MENITDKLETLILMALDANHSYTKPKSLFKDKIDGSVLELHDQGKLLQFDEMIPKSSYTFDISSGDRLFSTTVDYLISHPADILGNETEILMMDGSVLKWRGFRRLKNAPKGIACLGRADCWYEMHTRLVNIDGSGEYYKRVIPINKKGKPLPAKIQGHFVCSPIHEGQMLTLCASVIEDAHRANTMLAEIKDATEIKFPIPIDDYKEIFSYRDGPMNGNRRKSIIHWVAKHLRSSKLGNNHVVKKHTRGVQEFTIDGINVRLSPNISFDIKN